jgi:hypothetical protein
MGTYRSLQIQNQCLIKNIRMQVSAAVYTGKGVDKNALIEENYRCAFICWRNGILCCCTYARFSY